MKEVNRNEQNLPLSGSARASVLCSISRRKSRALRSRGFRAALNLIALKNGPIQFAQHRPPVMSLPVPEKIELKLAIVPQDTAKALSKLGLSDPPREEKRIHFFDTEGLLLFVWGRFERRLAAALVLAIGGLCAILSCQPAGQVQDLVVPLQIELDAFSGRPNPRWELTGAQAAEFPTLLRALPPAQGSHFTAEGLGYRGFVVSANEGLVNGYDDMRLYRGTVLSRSGDRAETFSDPERILERWLLRSARGHVAESVLRYIQSEIER